MRLLILSALPREVKTVLTSLGGETLQADPTTNARRALVPPHELIFAHTGMGPDNATKAFGSLVRTFRPDMVVSIGYCGALSPEASVGDLVWSSDVCLFDRGRTEVLGLPDGDMLFERLSSVLPIRRATFLTLGQWVKKTEAISHVPVGVALPVCDMETYGLARLAREENIPFLALRAVSDGAEEEIGFDPSSLCDRSGIYKTSKALVFFAGHPSLLPQAIRLARNSKVASQSLARGVKALLKVL